MLFEWDESKNRSNLAKHKVSFEAATLAFEDPRAIDLLDRVDDGEQRWHTLGLAAGLALLLVVHTYRAEGGIERIRIISARKATPHERKVYEEH